MDFSDNKHSVAELAFQGATEVDIQQNCPTDITEALATWSHRPNHQLSGSDLLRLDGCTLFSINYEGKARDYWPNELDNDISEILIRDFLFHDGICTLSDERARLFRARFTMIALTGDEYLLICPCLTEAGNISGMVVVTVTKTIRGRSRPPSFPASVGMEIQ